MKVEKQKPVFTPVSITLESQDEYDLFVSILKIAINESGCESVEEQFSEDIAKAIGEDL